MGQEDSVIGELSPGLARVVRAIDTLSEWTGQIVSWLVIPLMIALVWEVTARYAFNAPTKWSFDITYMLYGAHFLLLSAFTLKRGGHIRTDFIYQSLPVRWQGAIDATLYVLFFLPAIAILLWVSSEYAISSWMRLERSVLTPWMPPIYPLKSVIPISAALLLVQGFAELVKSLFAVAKGRWP